MYGFVRVGAAVPKLEVANCKYNAQEVLELIKIANQKGIEVLAFPELCITAYTCGDLFFQQTLIDSSLEALKYLLENTKNIDMLVAIGMPIVVDSQLLNCAVILNRGKILGVVPKTYVPNYSEFYEKRWFSSSRDIISDTIDLCGQQVPIKSNLLFKDKNSNLCVGVEICEDLWTVVPPSSYLSVNGANVILNLSASNETVSKNEYRYNLISQQSARCMCAYVYSSAGCYESTTDVVFSGHSIIAEDGNIIGETKKFSQDSELAYNDIDIERLDMDRKKTNTFMDAYSHSNIYSEVLKIDFELEHCRDSKLIRCINPLPFVPFDDKIKSQRCEEIFSIQVAGLAKRIKHTDAKTIVIGISGGLDSTLALLVCVKTCDYLKLERKNVLGITMPGFGTTDRTYLNAINLMKALSISTKEISIAKACLKHFEDIEHDVNIHDTTYENTQARERTQILMDIANKENGLVVGTGDLSELALGWATYNGDHMSMYAVNSSIPKTLVKSLVEHAAYCLDEKSKNILLDILNTPVSPELLPPDKDGKIEQKTEDLVGPYELHDFYLYYMVRFGFSPKKILYLAQIAFSDKYDYETILKWLKVFYRRFFTQQFKRSCMPDGPKVGSICLSPRGDWRMPSDASYTLWLDELNNF